MIPVKIIVSSEAKTPEYKSKGAAGADLFSCLSEDITIEPGMVKLIPTGIFIEIPQGYEAQIRPRSGLALNHGITLLNTPGTIDSDYRGEIKVIMANFGNGPFVVTHGMRIAQIVFSKIYIGSFISMESLDETERGDGGFGHTGI